MTLLCVLLPTKMPHSPPSCHLQLGPTLTFICSLGSAIPLWPCMCCFSEMGLIVADRPGDVGRADTSSDLLTPIVLQGDLISVLPPCSPKERTPVPRKHHFGGSAWRRLLGWLQVQAAPFQSQLLISHLGDLRQSTSHSASVSSFVKLG